MADFQMQKLPCGHPFMFPEDELLNTGDPKRRVYHSKCKQCTDNKIYKVEVSNNKIILAGAI